jgi:hypothetical protein
MRGIVALTFAVLLLLPAIATGSSGAVASVRVADYRPFTVSGTEFKAKERVRVVAQVKGRHVKTVFATKTGVFTARFRGVSIRKCAGYVVRATGNKGSRAYLRHLPECPSD